MAIHPTAIISPRAEIDSSVDIGPYCVIDGDVHIGADCKLYQQVYVTGWTEIGKGCVLHPGAIVGHEPQDTKYQGERSYCRIGIDNIIREYVTIHRGSGEDTETVIGDRCFLLSGSHVAHNCSIGNDVTLINLTMLAGHVEVGDRVTIGGGTGVHQFARIGELAMVRGNSSVPMDIPPFALVNQDGLVVGVNRIGLNRSGMDKDELSEIRESYRTLYRSGLSFSQAIETVSKQIKTEAGRRLVAFLQVDTSRGFAGSARRK